MISARVVYVAQSLALPRRPVTGSATTPLATVGMLGAGLFAGVALAASVAGPWLLLGLPIAMLTALCCALSAADQAVAYGGPGAVYASVRDRVGVVPGRIAASTGMVGHLVGMAAIARVISDYAGLSAGFAPVAILLVVLAATAGGRLGSRAGCLWIAITAAVLVLLVAASFAIPAAPAAGVRVGPAGTASGITAAAGVLFFAFAGFERVAAPEAGSPENGRLRRGLLISVLTAGGAIFVVAAGFLFQMGAARLALSPVPAADVVVAAAAGNLRPLVSVGAVLIMVPALLAALETFRSTGVALAYDGDLPAVLLRRTSGHATPYLLDLCGGVVAAGMSMLLGPASAIALSACCLLIQYALGNAAARLVVEGRTWAMRRACLGMALAVVLAMSMPVPAMAGTLVVAIAGPVCIGLLSRRWS